MSTAKYETYFLYVVSTIRDRNSLGEISIFDNECNVGSVSPSCNCTVRIQTVL